jgi:hypothetical protein
VALPAQSVDCAADCFYPILQSVSADQRNRLLQSTDRLNQSGERIKESRRVAIETEDIGAQILGSLSQQRETLLHARGTVSRSDSFLYFCAF